MQQYICITHTVNEDRITSAHQERGTLDEIKAFIAATELLTKGQTFCYRHVIVELPAHVENAWDATPNQKTSHRNRMCRAHTENGRTYYTLPL